MALWLFLGIKLNLLLKKISSLWHLPWCEKIWLTLLYPLSGVIRFTILTMRFSWLAPLLGQHHKNYQLSPLVSQPMLQRAWRIGRIVELTSRYTPWQSKCLVQAIMVRILLGYYRIPYVMHLGTRLTKNASAPMKAHAWVKVGPWIIVGREGHQAFTIVSSFISPSLL